VGFAAGRQVHRITAEKNAQGVVLRMAGTL